MMWRLSRWLRSPAVPAVPAVSPGDPLGELPPRPDVGVQTPASSGGRAGQVFGAVRINYVYQAIVLVAGLWLTPFLITHLGVTEYGLWIAGTQIVTWLYV